MKTRHCLATLMMPQIFPQSKFLGTWKVLNLKKGMLLVSTGIKQTFQC